MGIDQNLYLMVAVDAADATDATGRSLLERFADGDLGGDHERNPESMKQAMEEWLQMDEPHGLTGFIGGDKYEEDEDALYLFVGVLLADQEMHPGSYPAARIEPEAIEGAVSEVKERLAKLGVDAEPQLTAFWCTE